MKIILKHILRNIWSKKGRSLLIIIALAIATTTFTLNLLIPNEVTLKVQETFRKVFGKLDISISSEKNNVKLDDLNLGNEEIQALEMSMIQGTDQNGDPIILYGVDVPKGKEVNVLYEDVPNLDELEIVTSSNNSDKFEGKDVIEFYVQNEKYELKNKKIVESKGINAMEVNNAPVFVTSMQTINQIDTDTKKSVIYIDVKNDENIEEYIEYLKKNNEGYEITKVLDIDNIKEQVLFISSIMLIVCVLATAMIFFVINSLNKIIIAERMPVIGTFRSIGATKKKMNLILILENVVYGLIGGTIGIILANILNSNISKLFISVSGTELATQTSKIPVSTIIMGFLFAVILEVLMTIGAIIKANKKPIKDIIFDVQSTKYILKRITVIFGILLIIASIAINKVNVDKQMSLTIISIIAMLIGIFNIVPLVMKVFSKIFSNLFRKLGCKTLYVSSKNIGYNQMIIATARLTVISLTLIISILNLSKVIDNTFSSFEKLTDGNVDIILYNLSQEKQVYNELLELEDIEDTNYYYFYYDQNLKYNDNKKLSYAPTFIGLKKTDKYIKELNYKIEDLKYNEILIDEKFLENNHLEIGNTINLRFAALDKEIKYKIVGTVNSAQFSTARNAIIVNLDNFFDNLTTIPSQIEVKAKKSTDLNKLKDIIKKQIKEPFANIKTIDEYIGDQKKDVDQIMALVYVVVGLAVALSFIGIVNNQVISFMQRRRELAILNSTCMSKNQLRKMLFFETVLTNIISGSLAITFGFILSKIIDSFMQGINMYIEMFYDWKTAFGFMGIVFVVLLFTLIIPMRKLRKMNVVNEIKYE